MSQALKKITAAEKVAKSVTPQNKAATPNQVPNNAGGFTFKVSEKDRLERFLILGTDGGTYYVDEVDLTKSNVDFLRNLVKSNERLVVDTAIDVSVNGRAYKNSPAIFALAVVLSEGKDKEYARAGIQKVARTLPHVYELAQYIENLGGWGRAKRKAIAEWLTSKDVDTLAYQLVKYRQRNGWTARDLFRLSHPTGVDQALGNFVLGKEIEGDVPGILEGFKAMQRTRSAKEVLKVLESYENLPWETIPTQFLKDDKIWKKLFYNNQLNGQALVRNIVKLAKLGAFSDMKFAADYAARLTDAEMIRRTRLHPINFLNAAVIYQEGQTPRNGWMKVKDWTTESVIKDALDAGFHAAFKSVVPAGKRTMVAIDVSGSMASKANGLELSCAQVSGAVAMTIAKTEPAHIIRGFTSNGGYGYGRSSDLTDLGISAGTSLSTAMKNVLRNNFGGTDCSLPMVWAEKSKVEVDTFVVITDNETWAGKIHPFQALKSYRQKMGIDTRLAVLGVAATDFTIADPSDKGMMDFVGFDSNAPRVLADFSAGRI